MAYTLTRPAAAPGAGLLRCEHFQIAYVTNDSDRARALFTQDLGVRGFTRLEGPTAAGGHVCADFAWVGTVMYEIICATGPGTGIFASHMPTAENFRLVHHHLGFLVPGRAQWERLQGEARARDWPVLGESANALVDVFFVQVPGFAHYCEYLHPSAAGLAFFEGVERS